MKRRKRKNWLKLDNAAKIFPPATDKTDSKVFRFACELHEDIQRDALQQAVDKTLDIFPAYRVVLKHGLFWYYLEDTDLRPEVHEENTAVCQQLYDKNEVSLLFDVSYYKKRINFEIYHALADATGALHFLREIVCRYLILTHADELGEHPPDSGYDASESERMADSFEKYYVPQRIRRTVSPPAYRVKGSRLPENRLKAVQGILQTDQALALARQHGATLTALFVSLLIESITEGMTARDKKKPITVSIPVNLRKYFASDSSRNFFSVVNVSYRFREGDSFADLLGEIQAQMKQKLSPEEIRKTMNNLIAIEKHAVIRVVPLVLKDFFMNIGYRMADGAVTAAVSNIGSVDMPEAYRPYIRGFYVLASTNKLQVCICSYGNRLSINFTDGFVSADTQKSFFRKLTGMGLEVEIVSTPPQNF